MTNISRTVEREQKGSDMKLSKALVAGGLAILALAGAPSRSQADVKYTVENAVFDDTANTQLTGWFTINQYGQLGNWDLTVSQGTTQGAPISNGGLVTAYEYTPATTALTNTTCLLYTSPSPR